MLTGAARNDGQTGDDAILRRIAAGERDAFELLMRRYNRPLYRTARAILKDDAEAEDALQEAYLLAFRNLEKFRGDSALLTWLTRIVVNGAIARSRKTARTAQIIEFGGEPDWDDESAEAAMDKDAAQQPDEAAHRNEVRHLVEKKIDALPEAFRIVFMLRGVEELSVEETAASLGIPEATVRTRFFRARSMLRESLAREIDVATEGAFSFDGARCDRIVQGVFACLAEPAADG
jgi:RNA polymerase sigma-70 factor (ECF subfamily)